MKSKQNILERLSLIYRYYLTGKENKKELDLIERSSDIINSGDKTLPDEKTSRIIIERTYLYLEKAIDQLSVKTSKPKFQVPLKLRYGVAAMLAVAILTLGYLTFEKQAVMNYSQDLNIESMMSYGDEGKVREVILPDGTKVFLNLESELHLKKSVFNKDKREVWLTGEAFFEVIKNPNKPFIINTGELQTIVRGTSFNVKAYAGINENTITVRDGRVEVVKGDENLAVLTANTQLRYDTDMHKSKISETDWEDASGWMQGTLVLNGVGTKELKLRLQHRFGVTVIIRDDVLEGKSLYGSFKKEKTLEEVMNTISSVYNLQYKIEGNYVTIASTK